MLSLGKAGVRRGKSFEGDAFQGPEDEGSVGVPKFDDPEKHYETALFVACGKLALTGPRFETGRFGERPPRI